jgi:hypothetical protein
MDGNVPSVAQRATVFGLTFKSSATSPDDNKSPSPDGDSTIRRRERRRGATQRLPRVARALLLAQLLQLRLKEPAKLSELFGRELHTYSVEGNRTDPPGR